MRQYFLLPFLLALVSALNVVLTLASLLPWFKKARHRFFLKVAEVQDSNAMGKLWEEVGDMEYFWPRMKELWYRLDHILRFVHLSGLLSCKIPMRVHTTYSVVKEYLGKILR